MYEYTVKEEVSMKSILVVEDDSEIRDNLEQLLNGEGFNVYSAKNGIEGYKIALENLPDLIISDIKMPEMDGIELAQKIQNNEMTFSIPFIFISAKIELKNIREGMRLGADDYIPKPFQIEDVLNSVNARLRKSDLRQNFINNFSEFMTKKIPHEFRTPLVGILGMSDMILQDFNLLSVQEIKEMVYDIKKSGEELHSMVEKFVKYAELFDEENYHKKNYLVDSSYQINPLKLTSILKYNTKEFKRKEDLIVNFESANLKILGKFFETAITELLENSLKFSSKNKKINVSGNKNGNNYLTKIIDEGDDFTSLELDKLGFIGKYSLEKNFRGGLGLGLFLVKNIVQLFQGDIKFYRFEGKYNIVEFNIALKEI